MARSSAMRAERALPRKLTRDAWWMEADDGAASREDGEAASNESGGAASNEDGGAGAGGGGATPQAAGVKPQAAGAKLHAAGGWRPPGSASGSGWLLAAAAGLAAFGDFLFRDHAPGLSLVLFALAIFAVASWGAAPARRIAGPFLLLCAGAAPVVEYVQPLSVGFLAAALLLALAWLRAPGAGLSAKTLVGALRLALALPVGALEALRRRLQSGPPAGAPGRLRRLLRNWALPVGALLAFGGLLAQANPVLEALLAPRWPDWITPGRIGFWIGVGLLVWPLIDADSNPADSAPLRPAAPGNPHAPLRPFAGVNPDSLLRALVALNLLLAAQTALDVSILIGGAKLPAGMSYAAYAHRGAYPLLAAALLAGALALAARPFLRERRAILPLVLLWLAQNVALCASALLRLDLYVDAYGLTYWRIATGIWIGLVGGGLLLIGWQAVRGHTREWLTRRAAWLVVLTLYACCFVNFAEIIAARNLRAPGGDLDYVCGLDATAARALGPDIAAGRHMFVFLTRCWGEPVAPADWREWGLRKSRVASYFAAMQPKDSRVAEPAQ